MYMQFSDETADISKQEVSGRTVSVFYKAKNPTDKPVIGIAT